MKAIKKGKDLEKGQKVHACSLSVQSPNIYLTGIVGAMYKGHVTYWFKLQLHKYTGEVMNSHCECPGGKRPQGTCKHIAAVLQMLSKVRRSYKLFISQRNNIKAHQLRRTT